ncbi:MAG TPA: DUF1616 domain-containing protein [Solirubrobacterales bacterium]|nr:DUF1616 domain-containing protein [Solirubrobacterales bacterium]
MRGHRDLILASAAALACAVLAVLVPVTAVRVFFAIPLCLFLPGYAIAAVTFARNPLGRAQTALLSVALSLCVLALGALLLNFLGGLHTGSWALFLALIVLACSRAAAVRRPHQGRRPQPSLPRIPLTQAVLYCAGAVAAVAAVALAFVVLPAKNAIGHTELWITTANAGPKAVVQVGVRSQEQHEGSYFVRVLVGQRQKPLVRVFDLAPGEERTIRIRVPAPARAQPTTASLFRQSDPQQVYRRVYTWIPGEET